MIKVAICDDNAQALDYYQSLLKEIVRKHNIDMQISRYQSGEQILFMLSENPNDVDVIYLDILMGKTNGIETAKKLREMGCIAQIIFLTTSDEYVFEAFDAEPFYYIVKDEISIRKFEDIFLKVRATILDKENDFIFVTHNSTREKIKLDYIMYFEVKNRIVTVHMKDYDLDYYSKLEDIEKILQDKDFIRIHRSFIVNCYYIRKLSRNMLVLNDGTELTISEKYVREVQEKFSKYLLK
jgi:two-component system response regulator LytT